MANNEKLNKFYAEQAAKRDRQTLRKNVLSCIFVCLVFYGWGMNISRVATADYSEWSGRKVIQVIGIPIVPVGIVSGFVSEETNINEQVNL